MGRLGHQHEAERGVRKLLDNANKKNSLFNTYNQVFVSQ